MVEIVQTGTYVNRYNRKYRVQCRKCKAIFRFDPEDSLHDPLFGKEYIECPQCHVLTERSMWVENKDSAKRRQA